VSGADCGEPGLPGRPEGPVPPHQGTSPTAGSRWSAPARGSSATGHPAAPVVVTSVRMAVGPPPCGRRVGAGYADRGPRAC